MADLPTLTQSMLRIYRFSEEQISRLLQKLTHQKVAKKEYLLKPPFISDRLHFVTKGSLRYYALHNEEERTLHFFTEEQWVADLESFLLQKPSRYYIQAIEDCELYSLRLDDLHQLMDTDPAFRMLNALIKDFSIPSDQLITIQEKSPDARYQDLLFKHPEWINRFPQHYIASYLGMTRETLSRVRSRLQ